MPKTISRQPLHALRHRAPPKASDQRVRIGRSRTGLGLFATEPIKKGAFIVEYWGKRIPNKLADELNTKYLFEVNSRWTIDGSDRRNLARYANHGCRPNAESDIIRGIVKIRARKNIKPGEEITYDYGKDYFASFIKKLGCKCDACVNKRRLARAEARARKKKNGAAKVRHAAKSKLNGAARGRNSRATPKEGRRRAPHRVRPSSSY